MTQATTTRPEPAPEEVKARHRAMWALGDYADVAATVIPSLGPVLVDAVDVQPGERVLDVAAGSGNAAIPAARRGASVTASDLVPGLLETGRALAADAGVSLTWEEGDAERLPYADGSFDVVISCVGVMFAPIHQAAAAELVRVTRPGGRIGLLSWTPTGFIGRLFATLKPFAPPPPPGAQPPPLWGDEAHVRSLLGDAVTDVHAEVRELVVERFAEPEEFRRYFTTVYGPTVAVHRATADDPARRAELESALDALAAEFTGDDGVMRWEYLLLTARRAG